MSRPNAAEPQWLQDAVELMIRSGLSLAKAASELKANITTLEADNILRRRSFQKLLAAARHRYYTEIGSDPNLTKTAIVGKLLILADKLTEEGEHDKAAEVIFKVAKLRDWIGSDSNINVFGGLTARDYADIRKSLDKPDLNASRYSVDPAQKPS